MNLLKGASLLALAKSMYYLRMLHKELRYNVTVSVTKTSFSIHRVLHWAARKTVAHCIYEAYLNLKRKLRN